jgi:hypothetical protein
MATSEILGLFQTPDQYAAAQDAALQRQFIQRATLDPFQKASVLGQQAGYSAAQGIGGALGGKDPQLEMISRRNVLLGQLDPNDPKSYGRVAEAAARMGDSQFAVLIAQEGRKAASEMALAQQRLEEKKTPQERNAAAYARSVAEPGTPQYNSIYQTTLQALISKEKPDLTTTDQKNARDFALRAGPEGSPAYNEAYIAKLEQFTTKPESRPVIKEIGVAKGTEEAVYTYQQGNNPPQQVVYRTVDGQQQIVPYSGPVDRTTAKVSASASSSGAKKGAEQIAELDAKRLNAAQVSSGKAIEQAGLLQELLKTPQPISGSGAPARVGALRVFSTFGLTSSKDDEALGNADKFNALAGERVISFIKALGSNPTDTDREFARTIGPALEKGTKTNTDLINFLLERSRQVVTDASQMERHFYDNEYSLRGYKSPFLSNLETPKSKASDLTTEQLKRIARGEKP